MKGVVAQKKSTFQKIVHPELLVQRYRSCTTAPAQLFAWILMERLLGLFMVDGSAHSPLSDAHNDQRQCAKRACEQPDNSSTKKPVKSQAKSPAHQVVMCIPKVPNGI